MKQNCMNCGAVVEEGEKICPNCGRVIMQSKKDAKYSAYNQVHSQSRKKRRDELDYDTIYSSDVLRQKARKNQSNFSPEQRAALEDSKYQRKGYSGRQNYGKLVPFFSKLIKIILVLVLLYLLIWFVRITMTKNAGYKFDTKMELPCSNYGEAFDAYFEEGSWHYDITRNRVSYEGTKWKKAYKLTFKRENGQTVVDSLTIDNEQIKKSKIMNDYVLGMFMSEGTLSNKEKREKAISAIN